MEREIAINIQNVKKEYRIGAITRKTLQADIQSWWAKKRGKENPNLKIGTDERLIGEKFWALNGIDLTIYKGEAIGIIGANGAGKSTLLKLLSRITAPTVGNIDLYGRVSSMLEVGTGFNGELTGRENVYMNGAILGMTRKEIDDKMEQIIEFSEIRDFIDTPAKRYSSGMYVKLATAVAVHLDSEIMIMDEVLAVGDMAYQEKCLKKMKEAAQVEGRTVLYVSHNMATIRNLCERCIVLSQGKIIYDGDVEQAIALYMNSSIGDNEVDIDLTKCDHNRRDVDTGLTMARFILTDRISPVYSNGETIRMKLSVNVTRPTDNVRFRLTLRNESDVGIGTAWSETMDFDQVGISRIDMELPVAPLAKGIFYGSIGLYRESAPSIRQTLDHITRAFKIEILGDRSWNVNAHGVVELGEITCGKTE